MPAGLTGWVWSPPRSCPHRARRAFLHRRRRPACLWDRIRILSPQGAYAQSISNILAHLHKKYKIFLLRSPLKSAGSKAQMQQKLRLYFCAQCVRPAGLPRVLLFDPGKKARVRFLLWHTGFPHKGQRSYAPLWRQNAYSVSPGGTRENLDQKGGPRLC